MSQISPPIRILLVVAVAFLAIYMAFLRPKSSTPATPAATPSGNVETGKPAVTQYGKAVEAAKGAAKATEDQMEGEARSAGAPGAKAGSGTSARDAKAPSSAAAAAVAKADLDGLPRPIRHAIREHKVLVLLFWNGRSADDRAVHAAVNHAERFRGAVYFHTAPVKSIARYGRITRGADVQQSPTVVVVDRELNATKLVGYVDRDTVDQAVLDALRASGGVFSDPYLRRLNKICSSGAHDLYAIPRPDTLPQARRDIDRYVARADEFAADFAAVPAPKKWRGFKHASVADLNAIKASNHRLLKSLKGHPKLPAVLSTLVAETGKVAPVSKRLNHRMDEHGLIFCGSRN